MSGRPVSVIGLADFGQLPAVLGLTGRPPRTERGPNLGTEIAYNIAGKMMRLADRMKLETPRRARPEDRGRKPVGRLLEFPVGRRASWAGRAAGLGRPAVEREPRQRPRERFLRAIEMERRGFVDGSIAHLRSLHDEVTPDADPRLAINIHYFLGSFLMLRGDTEEARQLAEDGILLAWEHGASEELDLLESLSEQLED